MMNKIQMKILNKIPKIEKEFNGYIPLNIMVSELNMNKNTVLREFNNMLKIGIIEEIATNYYRRL